MAKVRMTERFSVSEIQERYEATYECTYCDECGSFDLAYSSRLPDFISYALAIVMLGSLLAAILALYIFDAEWYLGCAIGLTSLLAFAVNGVAGYLECRNCGNRRFTSTNVMKYREDDKTVLDVPFEKTDRRKLETINI